VRYENDRLLRTLLHHDLQFGLHDDGNARKQHDGLHDENGRISNDVLHRFELVRDHDAVVQSLQWLFDENDEQLLYVRLTRQKIAGFSGSAVWSAVKKKLKKKISC